MNQAYGSAGAGLLQGIMQGILLGQMRQDRIDDKKREEALMPLKQKQVQLQMKELEHRSKVLDMISPHIQKMFGGMAEDQQQGPQTGIPTTGDISYGAEAPQPLTQQMSLMQMDPEKAAIVKQYAGIDVPGMQKAQRDEEKLELDRKRFERSGDRTKIVDIPDGKGGFFVVEVPYYGDVSQGKVVGHKPPQLKAVQTEVPGGGTRTQFVNPQGLGPGPSIQTKIPAMDKPIKEDNLPLWRHPETGAQPQPGLTPNELQSQGFVRIKPTQIEKINKVFNVKNVLARAKGMMEGVIPKEEKWGRLGGVGRVISAETQMTKKGQQLAALQDFISANRAQVAKALGEVGNLSEMEQEAVLDAFGKISDAGPKVWMSFALLEATFDDAQAMAFGKPRDPQKIKDIVNKYKQAEKRDEDLETILLGP